MSRIHCHSCVYSGYRALKGCFVLLSSALALIFGVSCAAPAILAAEGPGWPREFSKDGDRIILYQPQIQSWDNFTKIKSSLAVEVIPEHGDPIFGVMKTEAETETNFQDRTVLFHEMKIVEFRLQDKSEKTAEEWKRKFLDVLPCAKEKHLTVSMDRVLAHMQKSPVPQSEVEVNLDPPEILYSDKPAILVLFSGKPVFKPIADTGLMAAVNTNWDIFLYPERSKYYLLNGDSWLVAYDPLTGPWEATEYLPPGFEKLPKDANWDAVREKVPGQSAKEIPTVFARTEPAELIVTGGEPVYSPIPLTQLSEVTNTESVLFRYKEENFYLLTAGRWFTAPELKGPWTSATAKLPEDFAKIPDDHEKGFVKASVPGTKEAEESLLLASIPQTARVVIADTKCDVTYDGEPVFAPIEGTEVSFAINSPYDVLRVSGSYYCCHKGVWFSAGRPLGPFVVTSFVPALIYRIPASHPLHHVTYVRVAGSGPEVVYFGYTAGYCGEFVSREGVLVFGYGCFGSPVFINDWSETWRNWFYSYRYRPCYFSYGCGAIYHYGYGGYFRSARIYGPYGGLGHEAHYNPANGAWARGEFRFGPRGIATAREGFNPVTGVDVARFNSTTPYGSTGRFYVARDERAAEAGRRIEVNASMALEKGKQGVRAVETHPAHNEGVIARDRKDDLFVGHDGNLYKHNTDGTWNQRSGNQWKPPAQAPRVEPRVVPQAPRVETREAPRVEHAREFRSNTADLDRDHGNRSRGNYNATRYGNPANRTPHIGGGGGGGGMRRR